MQTIYTLYDAAGSPAAMRVKMWFFEKGLAFRSYLLDLGLMEQKSPGYLAINPTGVVPTLCAGKEAIYDSHVILRYLERRHPAEPALMPQGPDAWFEHERWVSVERELAGAMRPAVYETFAKQRARRLLEDDPEAGARIREITGSELLAAGFRATCEAPTDQAVVDTVHRQLQSYLDHVERVLADGRPWLMGTSLSLADLSLGTRLAVLPYIGLEMTAATLPRLAAYLDRFRALPSWQAAGNHEGGIPLREALWETTCGWSP